MRISAGLSRRAADPEKQSGQRKQNEWKERKEQEEQDMIITVAGEKKEVAEGITVAQLIEQEKVEMPMYVTVSVNEEFIESGSFDTHVLKENDEVEFLYFMGGGR